MYRLLNFIFISIFSVGVSPIFGAVQELEQEVSILKMNIIPDGREQEAGGIMVSFDLEFKYNEEHLKSHIPEENEESSKGISYFVKLNLLELNGEAIGCIPDVKEYIGPLGQVEQEEKLSLVNEVKKYSRKMFLPFHSFDLLPGQHKLVLELSIRNTKTDRLVKKQLSEAFVIHKPKTRLIKVTLDNLGVSSLDHKGEPWDYSLINIFSNSSTGGAPDIQWKLKRGEHFFYVSPVAKNSYDMGSDLNLRTDYVTISEGDKIFMHVDDHDVTSFSDAVGVLEIDPFGRDYPFGEMQNEPFGLVSHIGYRVDRFDPPRVNITDFKAESEFTHEGMLGLKLSFNYGTVQDTHEIDSWIMAEYFNDQGPATLPLIPLNAGISKEEEKTYLKPDGLAGQAVLFIPYFAFPVSDPAGNKLRLMIKSRYEELEFNSASLARRIMLPNEIKDVKVSNLAVQSFVVNNLSGLKLSFDYQIPEGYFSHNQGGIVTFSPRFFQNGTPVTSSKIYSLEEGKFFPLYETNIPAGSSTGSLSWFVPFSDLGQESVKKQFDFNVNTTLRYKKYQKQLGKENLRNEIIVPGILSKSMQIHSLKFRKLYARNKEFNGLHWESWIAGNKIWSSPNGTKKGNIYNWPGNAFTYLKACPEDVVEIRLANNTDLIEKWEFRMQDIAQKPSLKLKQGNIIDCSAKIQ